MFAPVGFSAILNAMSDDGGIRQEEMRWLIEFGRQFAKRGNSLALQLAGMIKFCRLVNTGWHEQFLVRDRLFIRTLAAQCRQFIADVAIDGSAAFVAAHTAAIKALEGEKLDPDVFLDRLNLPTQALLKQEELWRKNGELPSNDEVLKEMAKHRLEAARRLKTTKSGKPLKKGVLGGDPTQKRRVLKALDRVKKEKKARGKSTK